MTVQTGLRVWRNRRLVTQAELAASAGVSVATIRRLEKGRPASVRTIRRLARALRVHPTDLLAASLVRLEVPHGTIPPNYLP